MFTTQAYMHRISLLLLCVLVVSTLFTLPAQADSPPSSADIRRAATAYDQGRERFREEQYTEAAEKFEIADSYAASAAALRLAILARKEAGQIDRALTHAALALELYPGNSELASEAQAVIDESGSSFAKLKVSCDEPCELLLDNRIVHGRASKNRTIYAPTGEATIRASWSEGRTLSESVTLSAGALEELSFASPEIPLPEIAPASEDSSVDDLSSASEAAQKGGWHPVIFWTGLTLTVAGAGATTGLGIHAQNNPGPDVVKENCMADDKSCAEFREGLKNQLHVNIALGTTAAVGVFTVVSAILTDWKGKKKESTLSLRSGNISIRPTFAVGNGASLGATGTF